jgi:predicted Zn-dependent peptidase
VGVLSGGMSSRLFTEVREKRGLCYSVYASYHTHRDLACVLCYAGTTTPRAQETLDVTLEQLRLLAKGVRPEELDRLKTCVKSSLVMQQESSSARSGAIARDWYHLGRVRTLDEVGELVDALTADSINRYLAEHPPEDFTIVTLGSEPLKV